MDVNVLQPLKQRVARAYLNSAGRSLALCLLLTSGGLLAGETPPTLTIEDAPVAPVKARTAATKPAEKALTFETTTMGDPLVVVSATGIRYEVKAGETWHDALTRWAKESGYTLIWRAPGDLLVEAPLVFDQGTTFEEALEEVLRTLWHSRNAMVGILYRNSVLVITGRDS